MVHFFLDTAPRLCLDYSERRAPSSCTFLNTNLHEFPPPALTHSARAILSAHALLLFTPAPQRLGARLGARDILIRDKLG